MPAKKTTGNRGSVSRPVTRNSLATLIRDRMNEKGWSTYDVERRGGPPARTVGHLISVQEQKRALPRMATIQALAKGLDLPLARVQQAALGSIKYGITDFTPTEDIGMVVAAMRDLSASQQRHVADVVLRMVEALRDE